MSTAQTQDKVEAAAIRSWMTWLGIAAVAVIYILLRIHSLPVPLDRDEGVFGYTAQRILEGGLPYRDALDHKPPGVFYIYALALRFFPATASGVHLFLLLYNALTAVAVALLLRIRFGSKAAWLGGAFCYAVFSASPSIQGFTASTEMLMVLPITICLLCAVAGKRWKSDGLLILSGAAGAAAFWIKPTAATSVAFAAAYLLATEWLDGDGGAVLQRRWRDFIVWIGGAAAVSAIVILYFYAVGLFQPFIYWSFVHNVAYTAQVPVSETAAAALRSFQEILRGDFAVLLFGVAAGLWAWRERRTDSLFVLGFLLFSFIGTLPGFAYPHYFAQIAPAVSIASGWALSIAAEKAQRPALAFAVIAAAMLALPLYVHWDYFVTADPDEISRQVLAGINPFAESPALSAFLSARTAEQDYIFIFGSEPQILMEAHRKSPTPMVMMYPLTRVYPRYLEFQDQTWKDINLHPPAYILFSNLAASLAWDGKAKLDILGRLGPLIKSRYRLAGIMPVGEGKAKLLLLEDPTAAPPDLARHPANIFIYKRID